jgi:hypothetical protein
MLPRVALAVADLPPVFASWSGPTTQPLTKPTIECPDSLTLQSLAHPDRVAFFLAVYHFALTKSDRLNTEWGLGISAATLRSHAKLISENMDSAHRTVSQIVACAISYDLKSDMSAVAFPPLVCCLLAHYHEGWRHAYIRKFVPAERWEEARHASENLRANVDLFCGFLTQVPDDALPFQKTFCARLKPPATGKWALAFQYPRPAEVFRAMGWYPKSKQVAAMRSMASNGECTSINELL